VVAGVASEPGAPGDREELLRLLT